MINVAALLSAFIWIRHKLIISGRSWSKRNGNHKWTIPPQRSLSSLIARRSSSPINQGRKGTKDSPSRSRRDSSFFIF